MCGGDGPLTAVCSNGHKMHAECIHALVKSTYPTQPPCPLCRDQSLCSLTMSVMPDLLYMELTPFSQTAAVVAMTVGEHDFRMLVAQGGDPRKRPPQH